MKRLLSIAILLTAVLTAAAQHEIDDFSWGADTLGAIPADSIMDSLQAAPLTLQAQEEVQRVHPSTGSGTGTEVQGVSSFVPDPQRALWLSLVFPGGGQIYNRKYWKLPIIYGGFLGCAYALSWNNQMLQDYSQAYLDIMDSDPNTKSYEKMLPYGYDISGRENQFKDIFKNKKNYYRKYRDMSILAFAAVYLIAVIDAYVDAELSTFDISEDLSLQVTPAVLSGSQHPGTHIASTDQGVGMALRLNF